MELSLAEMLRRLLPPAPFPDRMARLPETETNIDNEQYDSYGDGWWDAEHGPACGLHSMNGVRLDFFEHVILSQMHPAKPCELTLADVGCGGGILTEALARKGFRMRGIDASKGSIEAAMAHARKDSFVSLDYAVGSAYKLPFADGSLDAVIMSDLLEHLHDVPAALAEVVRVLRPGGLLLYDTINRTFPAYLVTILLAQNPYFGVLAPNTHDHRMYITPDELLRACADVGLRHCPLDQLRGITLYPSPSKLLRNPRHFWSSLAACETSILSISYMGWAVKTS
eukprot:m.297346 g.297346  ORF g.297346 m.297346 type:complete len:283 (+) comp13594_c0_seq1:290-1138(+)